MWYRFKNWQLFHTLGEKQYKLDELMPIYQEVLLAKAAGTAAEFIEAFKTFDREGQGFISSAELRHCLSAMGRSSEITLIIIQSQFIISGWNY